MAVYQGTGMPAVSLPNGAGSLPIDVLPLLERFDKIYLWMDNDAPGQAGADKFVRKLGLNRCFLVKPLPSDLDRLQSEGFPRGSLKDANDCLRLNVDMQAMIDNAEPPEHQQIITFKHLRDQVMHEVRFPEEYEGTPVDTLPALTKIIKGFRKGEMALLTGPTGVGKTTLLSQISLDMAKQNVNTLWGSFEVKNTRLVRKMLQQFYGKPLVEPGTTNKIIAGIDAVADQFQQLPLYFMTFHGGSEVATPPSTLNSHPPSYLCPPPTQHSTRPGLNRHALSFPGSVFRWTRSWTPWTSRSMLTTWSTSSSIIFSSCFPE